MSSLVARESLLRKLELPAAHHPDLGDADRRDDLRASTASSSGASSPAKGITPQLDWLLIIPLLLELYLFIARRRAHPLDALRPLPRHRAGLGARRSSSSSTRRRSSIPSAIFRPALQKIAFLNPFTQVLQDIRAIVLYPDLPRTRITAADAFGFPAAD